ncbi:MAG: hypothetical protein IT531_10295 [Burkholderiales bacterium]|nr:hypothetical protein [Burkholderiales bacterium]
MKRLIAACLFALGTAVPGVALAQAPADGKPERASAQDNVRTAKDSKPAKSAKATKKTKSKTKKASTKTKKARAS